ncbi:MAG: outer membrane beta-barrel protein [Acidobacteriota bacterium]
MTWKPMLVGSIVWAALSPLASAQNFGVGVSGGWVNDVGQDFHLNNFNPSEVTGWADYRFEDNALLRFTCGSMRTQVSDRGTVAVPGEEDRESKERIQYYTLGVTYLFSEGFFTSGLLGGIGGYHVKPDAPGPDVTETAFGWHLGTEAIFKVYKNFGVVARLTYHNVSAHPHRQFVNLDAGVLARF